MHFHCENFIQFCENYNCKNDGCVHIVCHLLINLSRYFQLMTEFLEDVLKALNLIQLDTTFVAFIQ